MLPRCGSGDDGGEGGVEADAAAEAGVTGCNGGAGDCDGCLGCSSALDDEAREMETGDELLPQPSLDHASSDDETRLLTRS